MFARTEMGALMKERYPRASLTHGGKPCALRGMYLIVIPSLQYTFVSPNPILNSQSNRVQVTGPYPQLSTLFPCIVIVLFCLAVHNFYWSKIETGSFSHESEPFVLNIDQCLSLTHLENNVSKLRHLCHISKMQSTSQSLLLPRPHPVHSIMQP